MKPTNLLKKSLLWRLLLCSFLLGVGCSGKSQEGEQAPLISIPAPAFLNTSTSVNAEQFGRGEQEAVVVLGPQSVTAGNIVTVTNPRNGESDIVIAASDGSAGPLRVLAAPGDTLNLTQTDPKTNQTSLPTIIIVPGNRLTAARMVIEDLFLDLTAEKAYLLGTESSDGNALIHEVDVFDLTIQRNAVAIANLDTLLFKPLHFSCLIGNLVCVVIFADEAQTIATVSLGTGEVLSTLTNPLGKNDQLVLYQEFPQALTSRYIAFVSAVGNFVSNGLVYFTVDPVSGEIGTPGSVPFVISDSSVNDTATISRTAMTIYNAETPIVALIKEVSVASTQTKLLALFNPTSFDGTTEPTPVPLTAISNSDLPSFPGGLALTHSTLSEGDLLVFLSQPTSSDAPLIEWHLAEQENGEWRIVSAMLETRIAQGAGPLFISTSADSGCSDIPPTLLIGNETTRLTTAYTFTETADRIALKQGGAIGIGLSADKITGICLNSEALITATLSNASNDVTFFTLSP